MRPRLHSIGACPTGGRCHSSSSLRHDISVEDGVMRFQLLLSELQSLQAGIRAQDENSRYIKGWCVTLVAALAAVSVSTFSKGPPVVALVGVLAFWFVDAHFKSIQRVYIDRDQEIEAALRVSRVADAILSSRLPVPGLASRFKYPANVTTWRQGFSYEMSRTVRELREPLVFAFYIWMAIFLIVLSTGLHLAGASWVPQATP